MFVEMLNNAGGGGTSDHLIIRGLAYQANGSGTGNITCTYTATEDINVLALGVASNDIEAGTSTVEYTPSLTPTYTHRYDHPYNNGTLKRSVYYYVGVFSVSSGQTLSVICSATGSKASRNLAFYEIPSLADYTLGNVSSALDRNAATLQTDKSVFVYANKGISSLTSELTSWVGVENDRLMLAENILSKSGSYTAQSSGTTNGSVALIEMQKV